MITKTKTIYKISSILIDYAGSDTGLKMQCEDCSLTLEVNPEGEPVKLVMNVEMVNSFI